MIVQTAWFYMLLLDHTKLGPLFHQGSLMIKIHDKNSGIVLWVGLDMVKHIEINVVSTILYVYMRLMFMYNDIQANVYVTLLEIQHILSLCHAFVFYYHV